MKPSKIIGPKPKKNILFFLFAANKGENRPLEKAFHSLLLTFTLAFSINLMTSLSKEPLLWICILLLFCAAIILVYYYKYDDRVRKEVLEEVAHSNMQDAASIDAIEEKRFQEEMPWFRILLRLTIVLLIISSGIYIKVLWHNDDKILNLDFSIQQTKSDLDSIKGAISTLTNKIDKMTEFISESEIKEYKTQELNLEIKNSLSSVVSGINELKMIILEEETQSQKSEEDNL